MATQPPVPDQEVEFDLREGFLAPWGLANEEIPMHILWTGDIQKIVLRFAPSLSIVDMYNVAQDMESRIKDSDDDDYKYLEISQSDLITPGYFSAIFQSWKIWEDAIVQHKVEAEFELVNEESMDWRGQTHTIRPQIELVDAPEELVLTDEEAVDSIPVKMRYVGFGMAKVAVEAQTAGEIISHGEGIHHDLLQAMLESEIHKKDLEQLGPIPEEWIEGKDVRVPHDDIENLVREMQETASKGDVLEEYSPEELYQLADLLEIAEADTESSLTSSLYQYIELMLLNSIMDVIDRHPTENISLMKPMTKVKLESKTTEIQIKYYLSDNMDNRYEPIETAVEIDDQRTNGGVLEAEIDTEWENIQLDPEEVLEQL